MHIRDFFNEQVDENQNKLVLAVHNFTKSDWFITCCNIAAKFYSDVTLPIKSVFGIDEFKSIQSKIPNTWEGMKGEFQRILEMLDIMSNSVDIGGVEPMTSKVAGSIKDAPKKQLDYVKFFREKDGQEVINAPLTNLGCEGNFDTFLNDCKKARGSVKVQTTSDKNVIAENKLYKNEVWVGKTEEERRDEF